LRGSTISKPVLNSSNRPSSLLKNPLATEGA
jgi:hypothetical protein